MNLLNYPTTRHVEESRSVVGVDIDYNTYGKVISNSRSMKDLMNQSFTISCWVRLNADITKEGYVVSREGYHSGIKFIKNEKNELRLSANLWTFKNEYVRVGECPAQIGEWYHVAASFSESTGRRIYINGVLEANDYPTGEIEPINSNIYIGNNPFLFPREFSGPIDEVSLWNTALSQEQIYQSMANEIDHFDSNLVGYWKFNEGSGDLVIDHSDNGNNGSINGALWSEDVPAPPILAVSYTHLRAHET